VIDSCIFVGFGDYELFKEPFQGFQEFSFLSSFFAGCFPKVYVMKIFHDARMCLALNFASMS